MTWKYNPKDGTLFSNGMEDILNQAWLQSKVKSEPKILFCITKIFELYNMADFNE